MAYAAVISLMHTIQGLTNPIHPQITKSAYDELKLLLTSLVDARGKRMDMSVINSLDAEIRETAYKLEDVFDSYALYQQPLRYKDERNVKNEMYSFLRTMKRLRGSYTIELEKPLPRDEDETALVIDDFDGDEPTTVGLADQLEDIIKDLVDRHPQSRSVSLVGMAGIGKTHLAKLVYQHPSIVRHFDFMLWMRIGPKHRLTKEYVVDILVKTKGGHRDVYIEEMQSDLLYLLRDYLHGKRYLIVLDDVWNKDIHYELLNFISDNISGSRLCVTTRLEEVAQYSKSIHNIRFLDNEESWILLRLNVFGDKSFAPQLEKAGRKIAENCEGLPLLILVVANILGGIEKSEEYWNKVANQKTTTFTDAYDKIFDVLYSSYEYLPQHLKPCFLYMGVFPRRSNIPLFKMVQFLTVEDFLETNESQTLEDFVVECLEEVVSNSLAILCKRNSYGRTKSCKLHSAYWHLCLKEATKIKFLHVLNKLTDASKLSVETHRRLCFQNNILFGLKEVYNLLAAKLKTRSLLFTGKYQQYPVLLSSSLMFLKVLDALAIRFYEFPMDVLELFKLKYLSLTYNGKLPSSICDLQQLQYFIVRRHHMILWQRDSSRFPKDRNTELVRDSTCLPREIWDMQELKHLWITGRNLQAPSNGKELSKLLMLHVNRLSCTDVVFRSIPNLEKLGIEVELYPGSAETFCFFEHIGLLDKLKSFKCVVVNLAQCPQVVPRVGKFLFPLDNLLKLSLSGLGYSWDCMILIGSLMSLQVLKLRFCTFENQKWETMANKFQRLGFLLLEDTDLVHWYTDRVHFPVLKSLIIRHCYKLKSIPQEIGAIGTLKMLEVVDCIPSLVASIQEIKDRRDSSLQVVTTSSWSA